MSLAAQAQELLRQGRVAEAERAFERVLDTEPGHVQALNVTALVALRGGNLARAHELLMRACAVDARDPVTQHHLGHVLDARGQFAAAAECQRSAVTANPDFYIARLSLGFSLERAGEPDQAVVAYARALRDAQAVGRWLNSATTPPAMQPLIEHAVRFVRERRKAAFAAIFEPVLAKYGRESLGRVEKTLRIYLLEEPRVFADQRQQPTFLYFPDLPATTYFDRKLFDWIDELESHTAGIREELKAVLPSSRGRERVFTSTALEEVNLRGKDAEPTWNGYYFYRYGVRREDNCARCPRTAAALDKLPLSHVREHGPEVLYSVFTAGTHLLPHRGVTNTRLVSHLPLIVPEECGLQVGGEIHRWQEGRVVVFDDTFEHDAWNHSKQIRVVMIFDIWNPYLSEAEKSALGDVIANIGDFRHAVEAP